MNHITGKPFPDIKEGKETNLPFIIVDSALDEVNALRDEKEKQVSALLGLIEHVNRRKIPKMNIPESLTGIIQSYISYVESGELTTGGYMSASIEQADNNSLMVNEENLRTAFEMAIIELMDNSADALFGFGIDGMVYRFSFLGKSFIVIKRQMNSRTKSEEDEGARKTTSTKVEYELLKTAGMVTQTISRNIRVPKAYHHVVDSESQNEYIVMEHIEGKTIATLELESLINEEYIPMLQALLVSSQTTPEQKEGIRNFLEEQISQVGKISEKSGATGALRGFYTNRDGYQVFLTDTDAEKIFLDFAEMVSQYGGLDLNLDSKVLSDLTGKVTTPFINSELTRANEKYPIISSELAGKLSMEAGMFIAKIHAHGIFHNDLHNNNIMIDSGGKLVVIDFGLGTKRNPEKDPSVFGEWGMDDREFQNSVADFGGKNKVVHLLAEVRKAGFKELYRNIGTLESAGISFAESVDMLQNIKIAPGSAYIKRCIADNFTRTAKFLRSGSAICIKTKQTPEEQKKTKETIFSLILATSQIGTEEKTEIIGQLELYQSAEFGNLSVKNFEALKALFLKILNS